MEDYNQDFNLNGVVVPSDIIDKIIRSDNSNRIIELCLKYYEGRNFCKQNNIDYYISCGWCCVSV